MPPVKVFMALDQKIFDDVALAHGSCCLSDIERFVAGRCSPNLADYALDQRLPWLEARSCAARIVSQWLELSIVSGVDFISLRLT
jgi:hypothetical protein